MDWAVRVAAFYKMASADNRISPVHISLYFGLLTAASQSCTEYFFLDREQVMADAKIYSRVTYHRSMRQLHEYGYIDYHPSYVQGLSKARMIEL